MAESSAANALALSCCQDGASAGGLSALRWESSLALLGAGGGAVRRGCADAALLTGAGGCCAKRAAASLERSLIRGASSPLADRRPLSLCLPARFSASLRSAYVIFFFCGSFSLASFMANQDVLAEVSRVDGLDARADDE